MTALSKQDVNASLLDLRTRKALLDMIEVATVAAAGSSEADAASLTGSMNVVTASDGAKGVILPRGKRDTSVRVINSVAGSALLVYPDTGGQINALTATTGAFTVPGSNEATFVCDTDLHWYVAGGGVEALDNLTMANPINYDHNTTITAFATGGQASATALTGEFNNVTTVATAGDSVKLPTAALGLKITVKNSGAASLAVFPATGDAINSLAANLSVDIAPKGQMTFRAIDATTYHTDEFLTSQAPTTQKGSRVVKASDNAANHVVTVTNASHGQAATHSLPDPGGVTGTVLESEPAQSVSGVKSFTAPVVYDHNTAITAFATGGQTNATALTGEFNNVTVCATAADSVKLPAAILGQTITVKNSGAASLAVFPATGDAINALAADLSVDIPVSGELTFRAIDGTTWETNEVMVLPAPSTQKGTLLIKAADNAANHAVTVTNASHGQATVHTIPDPGGATGTLAVLEKANAFAGRLTTTDGVAAGTARVMGGLAYSNAAASAAVTTTATETLFDTKYSIPANTLKAGTVLKVRFQGIATATNAADTLAIALKIGSTDAAPPVGGTTLISIPATDVVNNDVFTGEFELICRTAGAGGTMVGVGTFKSIPAAEGTMTIKDDILASTSVDTTAAQLLAVSATWSSANAGNSCRLDFMRVEIH